LFRAAAVRGVLPSEPCSSVEVACASRRRLLPCSWSPSYLNGDARDLVLRASPTPAPSRGGLAPTRSSTAVSDAANRAFPDDLGPAHRDPLVPTASSASKPCSLHEAVRSKDGCPSPDRRCSPGLRPSRALLRPSLETCRPCGRGCVRSRLASATSSGATARRQEKPLRPHGRDGLVGAPSLRSDRSTRVPPLGGISSSLDLGARNRDRERVVLGGSDDSYQRPVSERRECSPGVCRLVAGLAASRAPPTLASTPCGAFAGGVSASSPRTRPSYGSVATR
jgi:hypothetical protein